jgi:hypothetical protein
MIPTNIINQLSSTSKSTHIRGQLDDVKMAQAFEWLRKNPDEKPTTTAHLHYVKNKRSVQQAWRRKRKQILCTGRKEGSLAGLTIIEGTPSIHQAVTFWY